MNKTYCLTTFGCQMNYSDSERIVALLSDLKLRPTTEAKADILIFNLCSVRQHAIDRIWGLVNKIKKGNKKNKKEQKIILTGCILPADKKKFIDRGITILDIKKMSAWPLIIKPLKHPPASQARALRIGKNIKTNYDNEYLKIKPQYSSKFTAYVPVMTGCNNFCSYCAVPYTRGPEYSRPVNEILDEVNNLIVQGYKEIILLGQNVNSYQGVLPNNFKIKNSKLFKNLKLKIKNYNQIDFSILLRLIDMTPGTYWLSFLTSHPKDMSVELIKCFKICKHLTPYLHLALQSGSNKILKAMNRKYTLAHYLKLINAIRLVKPEISLSTDIIVGFPQETKKDFLETAKAMKKIKFSMAYLSEYSPRLGTVAANLKDNVSAKEKDKRKKFLNDQVLYKTALADNQKLLNKEVDVLVDSVKDNFAYGRTNTQKNVKINIVTPNFNSDIIGQFVKVKISTVGPWSLAGEILS